MHRMWANNSSFLRSGEAGFSLLEILLVMSILSIIGGVSMIQYSDLIASFNRQNGINQIEFDLRRARAESVAQGARGVFSIQENGVSYEFGIDFFPFSETTPPAADAQTFRRELPNNISFETATLIFDSRGYLIDESTGSPTAAVLSVRNQGTEFCVVSVSPIGIVSLSCP